MKTYTDAQTGFRLLRCGAFEALEVVAFGSLNRLLAISMQRGVRRSLIVSPAPRCPLRAARSASLS